MFYKSWINWLSNLSMIRLISKLLVQPLISLFQFYYVIFYMWMDLYLVVQTRIWENPWGNLQYIFSGVMKTIQKIVSIHALTSDGPNELQQCILLGASYVQRVVHALNSRFSDLPIFNATNFFNPCNYPRMIVTGSQILNCGSKGHCWSFNTQKKKVTCVRENS